MVKKITVLMLIVSVIALLPVHAYADLVPMSWGFPTFLQNSSLSNFEQDFGFNTDFESSAVSFPTTSGSSLSVPRSRRSCRSRIRPAWPA